jgi:uncharacterized protein (TIGR03503 family)
MANSSIFFPNTPQIDCSPGFRGSGVLARLRFRLSLFTLSLFLLAGLFGNASYAADTAADVRVLIDVSGSMKLNDPNNLRRPAVDLLVKLLPEGATAGVWAFGEQVNMLIPHKPVDDSWRKNAQRQAAKINSVALFTNIGGALEKSAYDLDKLQAGANTSIILLTDGMVDISKNPAENDAAKQGILREFLPKAAAAGVAIHTIALSENADTRLMERLAMETNGIAAVANSAEDLMKIFLQALDESAPSEQVPLNDNKFIIDSSVEEFTALIFHASGAKGAGLQGPDKTLYDANTVHSDSKWFAAAKYDLVTIQRPLEGEWQIRGDVDPDNRVTVVSDLSLEVNRLPKNVFPGSIPDMTAVLTEEGKVVTRADFLNLLDVSVVVEGLDSGKKWRKSLSEDKAVPADGQYSASLSMLRAPGRYEVIIEIDGKTFQRKHKQLITVRDAFGLSLTESSAAGFPELLVTLQGRELSLNYESVQALATIKKPSGRSQIKGLLKSADRDWELRYDGLAEAGEYRISVSLSGQYADGGDFSMQLPEALFAYNMDKVASISPPMPAAIPDPVAPPVASEPVASEPVASEQGQDEDLSQQEAFPSWLLYGGLVLGNLLIAGLAFLAYRVVKGSGKSALLEDEEDSADLSEAAPEDDVSFDDLLAGDVPGTAEESDQGDDDLGPSAEDMLADFADEIIEIAPDKDD